MHKCRASIAIAAFAAGAALGYVAAQRSPARVAAPREEEIEVMYPRTWSRRRKIAMGAVATLLVSVGVGFAAWTLQSQGGGKAQAGTLANPTMQTVQDADVVADLFPSATFTGSVFVRAANSNDRPVSLASFRVSPPNVVSSSATDCPSSNAIFDTAQKNGSNAVPSTLPANAPSTLIQLPNVARLDENAPTACMGVVFTLGGGAAVTLNWTVDTG